MNNTKNRVDVKVTLTFNGDDILEAATAATRGVSPWIHSMESNFGMLRMVVDDESETPTESGLKNIVVTPGQIFRAFSRLVELQTTHCSGYPIQDLDNADACTADLILQQAIYGEIVWG